MTTRIRPSCQNRAKSPVPRGSCAHLFICFTTWIILTFLKVLLILASPPNHPSTAEFWHVCQQHLKSGCDLSVYFLHEGASSVPDSRFQNTQVRLFACPRAVESFAPFCADQVTLGGPGLLAELMERAETIQAFSPS